MKSFMIFGAMVGFLIGAGFSLAGYCPWDTALWRACAAALLGAMLDALVEPQSGWQFARRHRTAPQPAANPSAKTKPAVKP